MMRMEMALVTSEPSIGMEASGHSLVPRSLGVQQEMELAK